MKSMKEIFAIIRAGEIERGVEMLYDVHYNKMYAIAFSIVNDRQTSEDIVHNVVYKLLTLDKELFPRGGESAWLYTVIKNEALTIIRREANERKILPQTTIKMQDRSIEDYVNLDTYYSMIKDLKSAQKEIVTLKVLGSYTYKEISDITGKSAGSIRVTYSLAIKQLRNLLLGFIPAIVIMFGGFIASLTLFVIECQERDDIFLGTLGESYKIINDTKYSAIALAMGIIVAVVVFLVIFSKKYKKIEKFSKIN